MEVLSVRLHRRPMRKTVAICTTHATMFYWPQCGVLVEIFSIQGHRVLAGERFAAPEAYDRNQYNGSRNVDVVPSNICAGELARRYCMGFGWRGTSDRRRKWFLWWLWVIHVLPNFPAGPQTHCKRQ